MKARREIKQERAVRTRKEILDAAIHLFGRRGFLATTMTEMAKAIKMTPGALYWHFATKEDLLLASVEELQQRYVEQFALVIDEDHRQLPASEQLRRFFERSQDFVREHREYGVFLGVLMGEAAENSERIAGAIRGLLDLFVRTVASIVQRGQTDGELRQDVKPDIVAQAMVSAHIGGVLQLNLFRETLSFDDMFDVLANVTIDGLIDANVRSRGVSR